MRPAAWPAKGPLLSDQPEAPAFIAAENEHSDALPQLDALPGDTPADGPPDVPEAVEPAAPLTEAEHQAA